MGRNYNYHYSSVRSDCKNMCPCGVMSDYRCKTYHPDNEQNAAFRFEFKNCKRYLKKINQKGG